MTLPTQTTLSGPRTPHETAPGTAPESAPRARTERTEGITWTHLIHKVQEAGRYPTPGEAEHITRTVLSALGAHVTGDERAALARALPDEAAKTVAAQTPAPHPRTAPEFVDSIAATLAGATPATARWHVSSVLSVLPDLIGDDLVTRVLARLPPGYALLFGRADLSRTP
ncbi:DUF2267 domain-containing protein [Streptomyces sp. NPDC004542]|uniref:DUF2267 domain-containing protein n=1 Tax=Streptomyces sp. NPDC004542 TaxID=3154281 RepID=UPI0033A2E06F